MRGQWKGIGFFVGLVALSFLGGCAYSVHQYHVSDSDSSLSSEPVLVQAEADQFVVMGFASDVKYVERAYEELLGTCPQGAIDNIHTRFSTSLGFFSWTNRIIIRGECHSQ